MAQNQISFIALVPHFGMANSAPMKWFSAFLTFVLLCAAPLRAQSEPIVVFAAASLRGVLEDIEKTFAQDVVFSFGGSGGIARQVALGAPADVVILASPQWMTWLESRGAVNADQSQLVAGNRLVVIGAKGAALFNDASDLPDRLGGGRLAIGQRDAVPAGAYAREWLKNASLWQEVFPQLVETDSVRAALALVARGETPFGVVYATDAIASPSVQVVYEIPENKHSRIVYPAASLSTAGAAFLEHLNSTEATPIWTAHAFKAVTP